MTDLPALREAVAAYAHEAWSGWMLHLFRQGQTLVTGEYVTPKYYAERWKRQAGTPYAELPESEKDSDRAEADKILALVALPALLDEVAAARAELAAVLAEREALDQRWEQLHMFIVNLPSSQYTVDAVAYYMRQLEREVL